MSYLVLARKWRPQTFIDLIGQEHVSRTLQNAIDSGRVAHAFLFTGARGVGKTSSARILAKALNCDTGPTIEPCNTCPTCLEITAGTSVDVQEIDGASNTGVDDVRELRETIKYLPSRSRYKIYVIDEVHMLSTNAFNALLKTLEEPPAHVKFIFATTEPHKLPITILSRCQRFDFKRIPLRQVVDRLRFIVNEEHVAITDTALAAIARKGDGSMRDSLSILDQVLAFCGSTVVDDDVATLLGVVDRQILLETSAAILAKDTRAVLQVVKRVDSFGYGIRQFCQELIEHFRNLVMMVVLTDPLDVLDLAEAELAELRAQVEGATQEELQRHLAMLLKAESEMGPSSFPRIVLELVLVKMASLPPVVPVDQLLGYLRKLEARVADGVAGPAPVWDAAKNAATSAPPRPVTPKPPESPRPAEDRSAVLTPPVSPPSEQEPAPIPTAPSRGGDWEGFVVMVASKKPILGSYLEHARPMNVSPEVIDIGFDSGFYLDQVKDADTLEILKGFAAAFFGGRPSVKVRLAEAETKAAAPTLVEKKSAENEEAAGRLRDEAASHPMVSAVLEIFGGELGEIKKR